MNAQYQTASSDLLDSSIESLDFGNKTIAVVGATGGLGTALSRQLARQGATVVLIGRRLERLERLYDALEELTDVQPAMMVHDLASAERGQGQALAETLYGEFGCLDALVFCAADAGTPTPQTGITEAEWQRVIDVNLNGARQLSVACLPLLKRAPMSSLVYLLDHKPGAYWGGYGVAKGAVRGLMYMLSEEVEHDRNAAGHPRIAINGYDPGPMRTPLRRRSFPGELESESPPPESRLRPLLHLIARTQPTLTGTALVWPDGQAT